MTDPSDPSARVTTDFEVRGDTARLDTHAVVRGGLGRRGWLDAASAAALAWLAVLCVAAVLLLAPKLQYAGFAKGADPIEIVTGIVILALGIMRVPVHIGSITISALPFGALLAVVSAIAWASAAAFAKERPARPWVNGAQVAALFGLIGMLLALIFRYRGKEPIFAAGGWSLVLCVLWSYPAAALGISLPPRRWSAELKRRMSSIPAQLGEMAAGALGGSVMLAVAAVLAAVAVLLWIIVGLARGAPYSEFGVGDALSALMYLAAFIPNIIVLVIALAMGAPIVRGAQVGLGGKIVGGLQEVSLLDWPGGIPGYAYLALLIPVVACGAGGWWIARRVARREEAWKAILIAAVTFALSLAVLAWLGEARLGAGLVRQRGVALIAAKSVPTFAWGMLWATVLGWLGWEVALRSKR